MTEPTPQVTTNQRNQRRKRYLALVIPAAIIILVCIGVWMVTSIQEAAAEKKMANSLAGHTYSCEQDGIRKEYEFLSATECAYREYDVSGYSVVLKDEKTYSYSLDRTAEDQWTLEIANGPFFRFQASGWPYSIKNVDTSYHEGMNFPEQNRSTITLEDFLIKYKSALLGSGNTAYPGVTNADYINAAKSLYLSVAKFPDTVKFTSSSVYEKDAYGRAIVMIDASAENALGVPVRKKLYICIQEMDRDGTFRYSANFPYCEGAENVEALKSLNDFGKHPNGDTYEDYLPDKPTRTGSVSAPNGTNLVCHSSQTDLLRYLFYTDPELDDHLAGIQLTWLGESYQALTNEEKEILEDVICDAAQTLNPSYDIRLELDELLSVNTYSNNSVIKYVRGGYIICSQIAEKQLSITIFDGLRYEITQPGT